MNKLYKTVMLNITGDFVMKYIIKLFICLFAISVVIISNNAEVQAGQHENIIAKSKNLGLVKLSSVSQTDSHTDIFLNYAIEQRNKAYEELKKHRTEACFESSWEITELLFTKALLEIIKNNEELAPLEVSIANKEIRKLNNNKENIRVFANSNNGACHGKLELNWDIEKMSYITELTVTCDCTKVPSKGSICTKDNYPSEFNYTHGSIVELRWGNITGRVFGTKIVETEVLLEESSLNCCKTQARNKDAIPKPEEPKVDTNKVKLFGSEVNNCQDCFKLKVNIYRIKEEISARQTEIQNLKDFNKNADRTIKNNNIKLDVLTKGKVVYIYENKYNGKLMQSQGKPLQDYQLPPNFVFKGTGEFPYTQEGKKTEKEINDLKKENRTLEAKIKANEAMIKILEDMVNDLNTELERINRLLEKCLAVCTPEDKVPTAEPQKEPTQAEKNDENLVKSCHCKAIQYKLKDLKNQNKLYKKANNKNDMPDYQKELQHLESDYSACNSLCRKNNQPRIGLSINFGFLPGGRGRGSSYPPAYHPVTSSCH